MNDFSGVGDPGYTQSMTMYVELDSGFLQRQINQPKAGKNKLIDVQHKKKGGRNSNRFISAVISMYSRPDIILS
jgi:hypothetical protein